MKKILFLSLGFCFISVLTKAQLQEDFKDLQNLYESFQYNSVIYKADSLLTEYEQIDVGLFEKINTLKAASQFSIGEERESRKTFLEILKIDRDFQLDSILYSPKLLSHFSQIKEEFLDITENEVDDIPDTSRVNYDSLKLYHDHNLMKSAIAQSMLLPGLGHLKMNYKTKGWVLTTISSVTLGSMIYFIFDTHSKEEIYLKENSATFNQSKYDDYNKSYKIRNSLIIAYAAIWLYSQIDLLFFSNTLSSEPLSIKSYEQIPGFKSEDFVLTFQIQL